ncbi:MAG: ABC transporter ATP-binding protein [Bacteroidota bacterium]
MVNTMKELISISQLSVGYHKSGENLAVLKDLNLSFHASQLVGIVGLNGVGKSTLLKSIAGLLPLISGEIIIDGIKVQNASYELLAKKVSIVLTQKFGGFNLRVIDVVRAGRMPYTNAFNQLTPAQEAVVESAITMCGLGKYRNTYISELSDGYFQRTVIAKALAQQTEVMLLDEPSAYLDYASKNELMIMLKGLCEEEKKCILLSSHDLDILLKYCHQLLVINEQEVSLIAVGEAKQNKAFMAIAKGFI